MENSARTRIAGSPLRLATRVMVAVLVAAGMLLGATSGPATAASAAGAVTPAVASEQDLGGQTLLEYCQAFGWTGTFQDQSSPTGWWCTASGGLPRVILNLDSACQWQFADIVRAGFVTFSSGGHCKTVATSAGRISDLNNIGGYCKSLGFANAVVTGSAVTSWYCSNSSGIPVLRIDLHAACRWVNQSNPNRGAIVVSYFPNYGARFEITCIALVH